MADDLPQLIDPDSSGAWGQQRRAMRHETSVPGRIVDYQNSELYCTALNISATGMRLELEASAPEIGKTPLKKGTFATVWLEDEQAEAGAERELELAVEIMWRTVVSCGVRFRDMTPAQRDRLEAIVEAAVRNRIGAVAVARERLGSGQLQVFQACRDTVRKKLPNILYSMRIELINRLKERKKQAGDEAKLELQSAIAAFERAMLDISTTIENEFLASFEEAADLDVTQELKLDDLADTVSLASILGASPRRKPAKTYDGNLEGLAHRIDEKLKKHFFELSVRMANVMGHTLDESANSLTPKTATRIFWSGVVEHCDNKSVKRELQSVLFRDITPLLDELYDALDEVLDRHNVPHFDTLL